MTVLFDSDQVPAAERADALHNAYTMDGALRITFAGDWAAHRRVEGTDLQSGARLLRSTGGPLQLIRTSRDIRAHQSEILLLGVNRQGEWSMDVAGSPMTWPAGRLAGIDSTVRYDVQRRTGGRTDVLMVSYAQLGVSVELVRAATRS